MRRKETKKEKGKCFTLSVAASDVSCEITVAEFWIELVASRETTVRGERREKNSSLSKTEQG